MAQTKIVDGQKPDRDAIDLAYSSPKRSCSPTIAPASVQYPSNRKMWSSRAGLAPTVPASNPSSLAKPNGFTVETKESTVVENEAAAEVPADPAEENYKPKTIGFWLVMLSNFVALFLVALDRTILATAVPRITDEFKSLSDIGWYGSAYLLATASSQLLFGRIYKFYIVRWVYFGSIIVFELGSLICGTAPNSSVFIIGRVIAGFGSAGIFTGSMMVIFSMVPLHKRPVFQSIFGMVFGVASVIGPLAGGGFAGRSTWRWCFYMNLPIGGMALVLLFFLLKLPTPNSCEPAPFIEHVKRLDPVGTFFFVPSVVSLLLALQWGGATYAWDDARITALFVVAGLASVAFAAVQIWSPKTAQVPVPIITQRSMLAGAFFMFFLAGAMMLAVYYVPLWFQAVKGFDPVASGIYSLPLVLSIVVSSFASGVLTQKIGYYVPSMLVSSVLTAAGSGLMGMLQPSSVTGSWVGFQFLAGFGIGFGLQQVGLAVQVVLPRDEVSMGIAISFFAQQLGGAVFLCVGQAVLNNILVSQLSDVLDSDVEAIVMGGATDLHNVVPEDLFHFVIEAYNMVCTRIFFAGMACALAALVCALCMQWKCIKKSKSTNGPDGKAPID